MKRLASRILENVKAKLGICKLCIRLSLILSAVFLSAGYLLGVDSPIGYALLVLGAFMTALFISHMIAWIYRRFLT
ncbi:MAG: hypothetical protein QXP96_05320 [Thermoproteota archaeon]